MDVPQETEHERQNSDIFISWRYDTSRIRSRNRRHGRNKQSDAEYEGKTGAQPFDMATGERIQKVTREQNEVLMVHPIAGG